MPNWTIDRKADKKVDKKADRRTTVPPGRPREYLSQGARQ